MAPQELMHQAVGGAVRSGATLLKRLVHLPRNANQVLLLALDMVFIAAAMWSALALRHGHIQFPFGTAETICVLVTLLVSALVFLRLGLYRAVIRFMGQQALWAIIRAVSYSTLVLVVAGFATQSSVPRSVPFIYWAIALVLVGGTRLIVRAHYHGKLLPRCEKVIIYGAGESGRLLLSALNHSEQYRAVGFVDDAVRLQHSVIHGVPVVPPTEMVSLIEDQGVSQVLLALPSAETHRRREIINSLVDLPVYVRTVPRFEDILWGRASAGQVQDIEVDDLLGRDPIPPHAELIDHCIRGRVVMVTGAGGSIGSELCRQILQAEPQELVLFDNSEYALYSIERALRAMLDSGGADIGIVPVLGSVQDRQRLQHVFGTFKVDTVYHAAAYKHVPLLEYNIVEGVANNVLGTWHMAQAAVEAGVEKVVLVSTDKAVRPTNVMGASKRFAEMLCQALATRQQTRFCIVRFGNVLDSSGSVVPLFREQIRVRGPITVTHPEVTRYFMTITESAQLVLQAGAMGTGGDVFVLNMGEQVKIVDLARRMVRLSGYSVKDSDNPKGDIEIEFIGLRPGEKLYEELMLGNNVSGTDHPMVMRAEEEFSGLEQMKAWLDELKGHCAEMDCDGIRTVLMKAVSGFNGHDRVHDHLWVRQQSAVAGQSSGGGGNVRLFPSVTRPAEPE